MKIVIVSGMIVTYPEEGVFLDYALYLLGFENWVMSYIISKSLAEFCCPKPVFRELKAGWISDRSVCYLANSRPVLAEDTGFSDHLPTGRGFL